MEKLLLLITVVIFHADLVFLNPYVSRSQGVPVPGTKFNPPFYNCGQARCTALKAGMAHGLVSPKSSTKQDRWPVFGHAATAKLWKCSSVSRHVLI